MSAVPAEPEYTPAELASMTVEERAAIGVELDDKKPVEKVEEGEPGSPQAVADAAAALATAEAAKVAAAAAAVAAAAPAAAAAAAPAATAAAPAAAAEAAPAAIADVVDPITVRTSRVSSIAPITDEAHAASQAALVAKFDSGEVTTPQFIIENDKLTRAKIAADSAASSSVQDEASTWQARQDAFFNAPGNALIRDDARVWAAMQAQLESMYVDPKFKDYSDMQYLNEAGREVRKLFGLEVATAATPAAAAAAAPGSALSTVPLPKTLGDVPAAAENVDGGEFAFMDKLDGMDYETAVARMTPDQKARFLA
jgi:hypothetical protein